MLSGSRIPWSRVTPLDAGAVDVVAYDAASARAVRCTLAVDADGDWHPRIPPRAASEGGALVREGLGEALSLHAAAWAATNAAALDAAGLAWASRSAGSLATRESRIDRLAARASSRARSLRQAARGHASAWLAADVAGTPHGAAVHAHGALRATVEPVRGDPVCIVRGVPGDPPWPLSPGRSAPPDGAMHARDGYLPGREDPGRRLSGAALDLIHAALRRSGRTAALAAAARCHGDALREELLAQGLALDAEALREAFLRDLAGKAVAARRGAGPATPPAPSARVPWARAAMVAPGLARFLVHDLVVGGSLSGHARLQAGGWVPEGGIVSRPFGAGRDAPAGGEAWDAALAALSARLGPDDVAEGERGLAAMAERRIRGDIAALGARLAHRVASLDALRAPGAAPAAEVEVALDRYALRVSPGRGGAVVSPVSPVILDGVAVRPSFSFSGDGTLDSANPDWHRLSGAGIAWNVWATVLLRDAQAAARTVLSGVAPAGPSEAEVSRGEAEVAVIMGRIEGLRRDLATVTGRAA